MSPRAALRLEQFGFARAYDYAHGKMDWLSYNLAHEGSAVLAGDVLDRGVPMCRLGQRIEDLSDDLERANSGLCIAVDDDGVVMGVVPTGALADPDARIEDAMQFGVTTVRPAEEAAALAHRMQHANVATVVVTSSDGRLLGLFHRPNGHAEESHDDQ